ncbi:MAG: 4-diphosphocytidyl-2C-methyl-D-erythritol synthase [Pseudonocardiales bacterium]|nr:4-diphosphocytidyl-2C-methyl-D-erythritol synthase [Pseudonocardiales bacterium]
MSDACGVSDETTRRQSVRQQRLLRVSANEAGGEEAFGTGSSSVGIVLAAGAGRRAGGPKAEFRMGGVRLVDRAVDAARAGGCGEVIAVVRAGVRVDSAGVVVNPDPDRGLSSSLRLGLAAALETPADNAVILLVDQPGITAAVVARLVQAQEQQLRPRVWFATYGGRRSHPVRIDRAWWDAVADAATGDSGARAFAHLHPELVREVVGDGLGDAEDLDTAEQLARWRAPSVRDAGMY